MEKAEECPASGGATINDVRAKRRTAILQAGFDNLATGVDDERVQQLYLSLVVLPDGHAFSVTDAAVLLHDRAPNSADEASVKGAAMGLERWSVLRSAEGTYRMHDAHAEFAKERLMDRGNVRRQAIKRWVRSVSSRDVLRSIDRFAVRDLWLAAERVGGDGWAATRPYDKVLAEMAEPDPALRKNLEIVMWFQDTQGDWEGASTTCRRLLQVQRKELGAGH